MLFQKTKERATPLDAGSRFQRAGAIVESRVNDPTIASTLMRRQMGFSFENDESASRRGLLKGARCRQPYETATDNGHIVRPRTHPLRLPHKMAKSAVQIRILEDESRSEESNRLDPLAGEQ